MRRLLVHVEGQTEENFVNDVLSPHLLQHGYVSVKARIFGNARQKQGRGGIRAWSSARNDIIKLLKQDPVCITTRLVDYYGLPASGNREWPGRALAASQAFRQKATTVEQAIVDDIWQTIGPDHHPLHFIPYVMMHEFEGMLFSDCNQFAEAIYHPELELPMQEIKEAFATPEEINDSYETSPSHRIKQLFPEYDKPLFGPFAIEAIGLDIISASNAPISDSGLETLENYPAS